MPPRQTNINKAKADFTELCGLSQTPIAWVDDKAPSTTFANVFIPARMREPLQHLAENPDAHPGQALPNGQKLPRCHDLILFYDVSEHDRFTKFGLRLYRNYDEAEKIFMPYFREGAECVSKSDELKAVIAKEYPGDDDDKAIKDRRVAVLDQLKEYQQYFKTWRQNGLAMRIRMYKAFHLLMDSGKVYTGISHSAVMKKSAEFVLENLSMFIDVGKPDKMAMMHEFITFLLSQLRLSHQPGYEVVNKMVLPSLEDTIDYKDTDDYDDGGGYSAAHADFDGDDFEEHDDDDDSSAAAATNKDDDSDGDDADADQPGARKKKDKKKQHEEDGTAGTGSSTSLGGDPNVTWSPPSDRRIKILSGAELVDIDGFMIPQGLLNKLRTGGLAATTKRDWFAVFDLNFQFAGSKPVDGYVDVQQSAHFLRRILFIHSKNRDPKTQWVPRTLRALMRDDLKIPRTKRIEKDSRMFIRRDMRGLLEHASIMPADKFVEAFPLSRRRRGRPANGGVASHRVRPMRSFGTGAATSSSSSSSSSSTAVAGPTNGASTHTNTDVSGNSSMMAMMFQQMQEMQRQAAIQTQLLTQVVAMSAGNKHSLDGAQQNGVGNGDSKRARPAVVDDDEEDDD